MTRWYIDSSAALKLALDEAESSALVAAIDETEPQLVGSWLLVTEMRRVVPRHPHLTHEQVSTVLEYVDLYATNQETFRAAGYLGDFHLRSLDAIHLAAAIRAEADAIVTYDLRMAESARSLGLNVLAPA